jgi:predicted ATPase
VREPRPVDSVRKSASAEGLILRFHVVSRNGNLPPEDQNAVYLLVDNWNDFAYVTLFHVTVFDERKVKHELGSVKIGFVGQTKDVATYSKMNTAFEELGAEYFSVGADVDYYRILSQDLSSEFCEAYLVALRDVARDQSILDAVRDQNVFQVSLLRVIDIKTIADQFRRVLGGGNPLCDFQFRFTQDGSDRRAGYQLEFDVKEGSKPTTNIHAIIGRNGVGKTTLLNSMTRAIADVDCKDSRFETEVWQQFKKIDGDYFSRAISVSFSAFDPFTPPPEQPDPAKGTCYFYVGLKSYSGEDGAILKSQTELADELAESLGLCTSERGRKGRWLAAIDDLQSDDNFAEMKLAELAEVSIDQLGPRVRSLLKEMSSGHAIVLLTITKLVARVEEKTLVLFDEPESHLHPPLLSALVRSLSNLLTNRNAVAIVATHSPVVLQEIPKSCVWKITRSGAASERARPDIETFGENVGVLTREVFSLEVSKSGYNTLLAAEAETAETYEDALEAFSHQLGFEGRALLQSMMHRPRSRE